MPQGPSILLPQPPTPANSQPLDQTPLRVTNPHLAQIQDFILGALGVKDALGPEASKAATLGMGAGILIPPGLAALSKLGRAVASGEEAARAAQTAIRAYHGSPHDFDQFSLSKIGTGEGAQVYGHGLYFAENPSVAAAYKKAGVSDPRDVIGNAIKAAYHLSGPDKLTPDVMRDWMVREGVPREHITPQIVNVALDAARGQAADGTVTPAAIDAYRRLDSLLGDLPKGRTYEVAIQAHPDEFLDWDKPLSQQSQKVQQAVARQVGKVSPARMSDGSYSVTRVGPDGVGSLVRDIRASTPDEAMAEYARYSAETRGSELYRLVGDSTRGPGKASGDAVASELLRQQGVKGIRYADQGSRNVQILQPHENVHGQWLVKQIPNGRRLYLGPSEAEARKAFDEGVTSNYVVFDDAIIQIMKKYGVALPIAAAIAERLKQPQTATGSR